jgi:hypothetical protein
MVVLVGLQGSDSDGNEVNEIYDNRFELDGEEIAEKGAQGPPRGEGGEFKDESDCKRRKRSTSLDRCEKGLEGDSCGIITLPGSAEVSGDRKASHSRLDGYLLRKRRGSEPVVARQGGNSSQDVDVESGVVTRAMAKKSVDWLSSLPTELWCKVLSHLEYNDIGRSLCVCKEFARAEGYIWKSACERMWPKHTFSVAQVPDSFYNRPDRRWRKCYEMLSLRSAENKLVLRWGDTFTKLQKRVSPRFRSVLVEWLIEVAQDWRLDSTVIFQAVRLLDHYLKNEEVTDLSKFQLIGVSCLRLAIICLRRQMKVSQDQIECLIEASRFATVCDGAASEGEVINMTDFIKSITPDEILKAPNAKMYLRCLWYTISKNKIGGCSSDDMHIYVLSAFLLELGLVDFGFSVFNHSACAAAAISLALEFYGKDPWPIELLAFSSYTVDCLRQQRQLLARSQALSSCIDIRNIWTGFYRNHLYHDKKSCWDKSLAIMTRRGGDFIDLAWADSPRVLEIWTQIKQDGIDPHEYDEIMMSTLIISPRGEKDT